MKVAGLYEDVGWFSEVKCENKSNWSHKVRWEERGEEEETLMFLVIYSKLKYCLNTFLRKGLQISIFKY